MKLTFAAATLVCLTACSQQDQDRAKSKVKQAGEELKHDAAHASRDLQKGAAEIDRKAGPKLHKAGEELKQDAEQASRKLKEGSRKLDQKLHQQ